MMATTHVMAGVALWIGGASLVGVPPSPGAIAGAALGSLLPDIDHPESWLGRRLWFLSLPISAVFGHRGITHSLIAVLACAVVVVLGGGWAGLPVVVGYLSHLGADALTPSGVPLLWPNKRTFAYPLVKTGSIAEWGFGGVLLLVAGSMVGIR